MADVDVPQQPRLWDDQPQRTTRSASGGGTATERDLFRLRRMREMVEAGVRPSAAAEALTDDPDALLQLLADIGARVGVDLLVDHMVGPALDVADGPEFDAWLAASTRWLSSVTERPVGEWGRMAVVVRAPEPASAGISPLAASAVLTSCGWEVVQAAPGASLKEAAMMVRPDCGVLVLAADSPDGALEGENRALEVSYRTPIVTVGRGFTSVEAERLLPGPGSWEELPWEAERSLLFWDIPES